MSGPLTTDQIGELGELTVPVIADALDRLGYRNQLMSAEMRPVAATRRISGPAFPIQAVARAEVPEAPYKHELEATDAIPKGAVVTFNAGGVMDAGIWGELLATRALQRGGVGAVIDGAVRDLAGLESLDFPTFSTGIHAADSYGRAEVIAYEDPIVCGGVPVRLGDLVVADIDGVVVVPYEVAAEALADASDKRSKEHEAQQMLSDGASARDTYDRHQVL